MAEQILTIKMIGMEEIKSKLKQLSDLGKIKATSEALRAGANAIRDSIKAKAPIGRETKSKRLKDSIIVKKKSEKYDPYNIAFQIGPDKKRAYYAHMVEFGTSLHKIPKIPGKKLLKFRRTSGGQYSPEFISEQTYTEAFTAGKRKASGGYVFIRGVEVAAKPHPFVRPGFDSSKIKAMETIKARLLTAIDKIAKKESIAGGL